MFPAAAWHGCGQDERERIGGTVDLQSTPGEGTTVRVKIPLTLAIIPPWW